MDLTAPPSHRHLGASRSEATLDPPTLSWGSHLTRASLKTPTCWLHAREHDAKRGWIRVDMEAARAFVSGSRLFHDWWIELRLWTPTWCKAAVPGVATASGLAAAELFVGRGKWHGEYIIVRLARYAEGCRKVCEGAVERGCAPIPPFLLQGRPSPPSRSHLRHEKRTQTSNRMWDSPLRL